MDAVSQGGGRSISRDGRKRASTVIPGGEYGGGRSDSPMGHGVGVCRGAGPECVAIGASRRGEVDLDFDFDFDFGLAFLFFFLFCCALHSGLPGQRRRETGGSFAATKKEAAGHRAHADMYTDKGSWAHIVGWDMHARWHARTHARTQQQQQGAKTQPISELWHDWAALPEPRSCFAVF